MTGEEVLAILSATPGRIAALTADVSPARLRAAPAPGEWSANEVLAHLRACADVWGRSIATILTEDQPTIRAVNPRTWIEETDYISQPFRRSLRAFTDQRTELLAQLERLPPSGWARTATVTGAGRPLTKSVRDYADRLARHERPHVNQIAKALAGPAGRP